MIICSLELFNFRQYIGKQYIEFSTDKSKNVTALIGVNTSGKTTIVRAFEWCLYNKNRFEDECLLNSNVRSQMSFGDAEEVYVAVTFSSNGHLYTMKRSHVYTCNGIKDDDNGRYVQLKKTPEATESLVEKTNDGQTVTIRNSRIKDSIDRALPGDLEEYFFFGGERVGGIVDRKDLSKAVRGLMGIVEIENACIHLNKVLTGYKNALDTTGDVKAGALRDVIETNKEKIKKYTADLENAQKEMDYWKEQETEYAEKISKLGIEEVKKAQAQRKRIETALQKEKERLEKCKRALVNSFNNKAYIFFGMPEINNVLGILEQVKDDTECVPGMTQDAIDYIIKRRICLCGTRLMPGQLPYSRIMSERKKLPPEHIGAVVMNFKEKCEGYLAGSENYFDNFKETYTSIRESKRTIGDLEDDLNNQDEVIFDDNAAKEYENKRKLAHKKYNEAFDDYTNANIGLTEAKTAIRNAEKALEKYLKSQGKNAKLFTLISYTEEVANWFNKGLKDKETIIRTNLEKKVNEYFDKMYHGQRSIAITDKYKVEYTDIKTEESDGLRAVKSFAFVASLVALAKGKLLDDNLGDKQFSFSQQYPLVMDAPFSNCDEIHIDNICNILPEAANQVIIAVMEKDWLHARDRLHNRLGKYYNILKDKDAYGNEIDTVTHLEEVKGV